MGKRPTFEQARQALYEHLRSVGWEVVTTDRRTLRFMKVPHATSPDGRVRIWFKPQAVWVSCTTLHRPRHDMGDARSLWMDIRYTDPSVIVEHAETYAKGVS